MEYIYPLRAKVRCVRPNEKKYITHRWIEQVKKCKIFKKKKKQAENQNSRRTYEKRTWNLSENAPEKNIYSPDENLCEIRVCELAIIFNPANSSASSPEERASRTVVSRGWKSSFRPPSVTHPFPPPSPIEFIENDPFPAIDAIVNTKELHLSPYRSWIILFFRKNLIWKYS